MTPGGRHTPLPPSPIKRSGSPPPVAPVPAARKAGATTPLPPSPIKRPGSTPGIQSPPPSPVKRAGAPAGVKKPGGVKPPAPVKDKLLGMTLGKVTLVRKIGHGGMGDVYLGEHAMLQRSVAVKCLPQDFTRNAELLSRFRREAVACARLEHPNIVQVYDIGNEGDIWYIIMTFVDGQSLQDMLDAEGGPLEVREAARIVCDSAKGLHAAHEAGIVHRDVKPANVLVSKKGEVRITDFGLAFDQESQSLVTMPGTMMGTPHFMSPEQAEGRRADERSDIYSVGVMLYYALTGHRPFIGESHMAVLYKHINEQPTPIRKLNPQVPEYLVKVAMKCLQKKPEIRYKTCADVAKDLDAYLTGNAGKATQQAAAVERPAPRPPRAAGRTTVHEGGGPMPSMASMRRGRSNALILVASILGILGAIVLLLVAIKMTQKDDSRKTGDVDEAPPPPPATTAAKTETDLEKYNRLVDDANAALAKGELDRARAAFEAALKVQPGGRAATKGLEDVVARAKVVPVDPPKSTDVPPKTPATDPKKRDEGFEYLVTDGAEHANLTTCCSRMTFRPVGGAVEVATAESQERERHSLVVKDRTIAEAVLRFDLRLLKGEKITAVGRHLHKSDLQALGIGQFKFQYVELEEALLHREVWNTIELRIGNEEMSVHIGGGRADSNHAGVVTAGRAGLLVPNGCTLQTRNWRIKVTRSCEPRGPEATPVSNPDPKPPPPPPPATDARDEERLAALVGDAERRDIHDRRYATVLSAARDLERAAASDDGRRRSGALARLLEGAGAVIAAFRAAAPTVQGETELQYRDGRTGDRGTIKGVTEEHVTLEPVSGGQMPVPIAALETDYLLSIARRKPLTDVELASFALCEGKGKREVGRLFPEGRLRKEALAAVAALVDVFEAARTHKVAADADVKPFFDKLASQADPLPEDVRERVKALASGEAPPPDRPPAVAGGDVVAEIEKAAGERRHRDARDKFAHFLKTSPDHADAKRAAEAAYASLLAEGWGPVWNGRDLSEFTVTNSQHVSVAAGAIRVSAPVDGSADLWIKKMPAVYGVAVEFRIKEAAAQKGASIRFDYVDAQNQRFFAVHENSVAFLQHMKDGKYESTVTMSLHESPKGRWVTLAIVVVGEYSLYFADGALVHRGPAAMASLGNTSFHVGSATVEVRNVRARVARP